MKSVLSTQTGKAIKLREWLKSLLDVKRNLIDKLKYMFLRYKKIIVKLRMWYADIRGHHGKRWDYEPGDYYMGRNKRHRK